MSHPEIRQAVVFILLNSGSQVLMEKRDDLRTYASHFVYPGGTVEPDEYADPAKAVIREVREELGVEVLGTEPLPCTKRLLSPSGKLLLPFFVRSWQGEIPQVVLDKGNPLAWCDIEVAATSPLEKVRILTQSLKEYLNK